MASKFCILAGLTLLTVTACKTDDNDKDKGPGLIAPTDPSLQGSSVVPSAGEIVGKWFWYQKDATGVGGFQHDLVFKDDGTYEERVVFFHPFFRNDNSGTYSITEGILRLENGWFSDRQIKLRTVHEDDETYSYIDLFDKNNVRSSLKSVK